MLSYDRQRSAVKATSANVPKDSEGKGMHNLWESAEQQGSEVS